MDKIKLKVHSVSCSQTQSGAFVLILAEEEGLRRIPIVIGQFEAQSIVMQIENIKPPRPFPYDLLLYMATAYNITINEVFIYKLENGVFYSNLICDNQHTQIKIDARTSDAVALALRFNCPIYTTADILNKSGITIEDNVYGCNIDEKESYSGKYQGLTNLNKLSMNELKTLLDEAIEVENYELASVIQNEINDRSKK